MQSQYLILAENITYKNNKLSCINILDQFLAVKLPSEMQFDLVEKLTAENLRLHPMVFAFASHLAKNDFRIQVADRLAEKLCHIETLNQITAEYGIDVALADTQVGLWLYGDQANKHKEEAGD